MVFAGEPEDGDVRNAGSGGGLRGAGDGGGRLQECEQRSAEQPDLLAGDDGARSAAEPVDVGEGLGAGAEVAALALERGRRGLRDSRRERLSASTPG